MTTPTTWPTCRGPTRASSRDPISPPAKLGEGVSASSPRLENRPPPRLRRYSPTSGGETHAAPRLENRPHPRLRRYSPTSGGEIHADPTSGEPTPSPASPVLPHKWGRNPYGPHVWRTDPIPGYAGTPPQVGEKSMWTPRLENGPPPRLRRYSPTSGGEIHADLRARPGGPPQPTDRRRR